MLPVPRRTPTDPGLLRAIYQRHYQFFQDFTPRQVPGQLLEVGCGDGFFSAVEPSVVATEIWPAPNADLQCSALSLPVRNGSIACLYLLDVLHHIQAPVQFFAEAERVLAQGGRILMVEPANTLFARFIFQRFHHEDFDPDAAQWELPEGNPREVANGALPWILFHRDLAEFANQFPQLKLTLFRAHMPLSYLLSGGLSQAQWVPTSWHSAIWWLEEHLPQKLLNLSGMFYQITLEKTS